MKRSFVVAAIALTFTPAIQAQTESSACALESVDRDELASWREADFANQQTDAAVVDFASCLGAPDPFLRDRIGYEGLTAALRSGSISEDTRRYLIATLSQNLQISDAGGFLAPFSALALSELARTDRVEAFLTPDERANLARNTATYITGVSDYRAFSDTEGWRHGVAHGADIAMQLALNEQTDEASLRLLRDSISTQITARSGHAFTHDEPRRLARPILFMAARGAFEEAEWAAWFASLTNPAPLNNWGQAYSSETDLARLHNLKAFARVLFINASLSEDENFNPIATGAVSMLTTLP